MDRMATRFADQSAAVHSQVTSGCIGRFPEGLVVSHGRLVRKIPGYCQLCPIQLATCDRTASHLLSGPVPAPKLNDCSACVGMMGLTPAAWLTVGPLFLIW